MAVGPPESERVDAEHDGAIGEGLTLGLHLHRAALEVDLRIRQQETPGDRGEGTPPDHQEDLEQGAVEGRGFHVADVALYAREPEGKGSIEAAEGLRDRIAFDAVADHGPGRVGLDVVEVPRRPTRTGAGSAHQLDLRVPGGRGDVAALRQSARVVGGAGRIDRASLHHGEYGVSVPLGRFERLDGERKGPFRAHVPVRVGVEGMAPAVGADDPQGIERGAQSG